MPNCILKGIEYDDRNKGSPVSPSYEIASLYKNNSKLYIPNKGSDGDIY
jgi:hypothetical protein